MNTSDKVSRMPSKINFYFAVRFPVLFGVLIFDELASSYAPFVLNHTRGLALLTVLIFSKVALPAPDDDSLKVQSFLTVANIYYW